MQGIWYSICGILETFHYWHHIANKRWTLLQAASAHFSGTKLSIVTMWNLICLPVACVIIALPSTFFFYFIIGDVIRGRVFQQFQVGPKQPHKNTKRPGGMKPHGRMKWHYCFGADLFHIHNRNNPEEGKVFFNWCSLRVLCKTMDMAIPPGYRHVLKNGRIWYTLRISIFQ